MIIFVCAIALGYIIQTPLDSAYRKRTRKKWASEVEEHEAWVADMKDEQNAWYADRSARQEQDRIDDRERRRAMKAEQDIWDEARRRRQEQDRLDEEERERKDQYVPEVSALDFTQNSESGMLDVDQETKDLLKSMGVCLPTPHT